jgi:putative superfamily III holin-X
MVEHGTFPDRSGLRVAHRCDTECRSHGASQVPQEHCRRGAYHEVGQAIESVQQELEQLRNEGAARAQDAARGAALLGGAGALGLVSVGALGSLPLMARRRVLPAWLLAALVAGGSAAGAAVLGRAGLARLAAISPEALEGRAKEAGENVAEVVR